MSSVRVPWWRAGARVLLGAFLVVAGIAHFLVTRSFHAQVPAWFPLDADLTVWASGVVEIGLGLALVGLPRHRRVIGLAVAVLLVAVFPGNVAQYVEGVDAFGLDTAGERLARLFVQPLLVGWALYAAGPLRRRVPPAGPGARPRD